MPLSFELWTQRQFSIAVHPLIAQNAIHQVKLRITVLCQAILMNFLSKFYYFVKLLSGSIGFHTSKIYQLSGLCKSQAALFHFIGRVLSKLELLQKGNDMIENYILLTGGHTGLGLGVTKKLLKPENKIGLIVRNESRKQSTLREFNDFPQELVDNIDFFFADLSDQAQVKAVAKEIKDKWPRIDHLFNNAAVLGAGRKSSKQGNEIHFEVNTLAPYLLTTELKPLLQNSANARVVTTVTAGMHRRKLQTGLILNDGRGMNLYAQSKQAVMLLMNDLAESWNGVKFSAVDPGPNKTKMTTSEAPGLIKYLARFFFNDPEVGSQRIYNAGFDDRFNTANGVYITGDKIVAVKHGMTAQDKKTLLAGIKD